MSTLKLIKKIESITEGLSLPVTKTQLLRYRRLLGELDKREYESLHSKARERLDALMDEVELELAKSS